MNILNKINQTEQEEPEQINPEILPWEETLQKTTQENKTQKIKLPKFSELTNIQKTIAGIATLCILITAFTLYNYFSTSQSIETTNSTQTADQANTEIRVFISGCVVSPGVYSISSDTRIIDIVNMAGGFTEQANKEAINLAQTVKDGEQITIPAIAPQSSTSETTSQSDSGTNNGKININTADLTTLQKLSGIGPSTAQKIIDYRNSNGKFKTIEDIKNVSGIGEKTFAKFSNQICV